MLSSVINEGLAGMQQSQKKLHLAAQEVARAGIPRDRPDLNPTATPAPVTDAGVAVPDLPANQAVEATGLAESSGRAYASQHGDIIESLLEQRHQALLFDASAKVVGAASNTLGSLIDQLT